MERIKEKLEFAKGRIAMLETELKKGIKSEVEKLGVFKLFQEVVEAYSDAIAIFIKSKNLEVKDRYSNIELLENLGTINKEEAKLLIKANGLRNWIVHRYNKLSDRQAIASIKVLLPKIKKFVEKFEHVEENQ